MKWCSVLVIIVMVLGCTLDRKKTQYPDILWSAAYYNFDTTTCYHMNQGMTIVLTLKNATSHKVKFKNKYLFLDDIDPSITEELHLIGQQLKKCYSYSWHEFNIDPHSEVKLPVFIDYSELYDSLQLKKLADYSRLESEYDRIIGQSGLFYLMPSKNDQIDSIKIKKDKNFVVSLYNYDK